MTIAYVISDKALKVKMVKVKAYSGDHLNDQADNLAKTAAFSASRLTLNFTSLPGLNLILTCDHLIIEASNRRCIKHLHEAKHFH